MTPSNSAGSDVLDVVIVGCGRIAGGLDEGRLDEGKDAVSHVGAYLAHPGFSVVACVEPDENRRVAFMNHWDIPYGFSDINTFIKEGPGVDVASICSPTGCHAEQLESLLGSDLKGILCEKPLAEDLVCARRLVKAYENASVPLAVHYLRRWVPEIVVLKEDIESGEWGNIQNIVAYYSKGLRHNGSHVIDFLTFLFGRLSVVDVLDAVIDHDENDPSISALLKTESGVWVHLLAGDERCYQHIEASLVFDEGRVDMEDLGRTLRFRRRGPDSSIPGVMTLHEVEEKHPDTPAAVNGAVENLYRSILQGEVLAGDGKNAVQVLETCEEIFVLWESGGRTVR